MSKMNELKLCPFCGGAPLPRVQAKNAAVNSILVLSVTCLKCGAKTQAEYELCDSSFRDVEMAMEEERTKWNQRAHDA